MTPASIKLLIQQGVACLNRQESLSAEQLFRAAIAEGANHPAALHGLGKALHDQRRFSEAESIFIRAAKTDRSPALGRYHHGLSRLTQGDLPGGWPGWEARPAVSDFDASFPLPRWSGDSLKGRRLLVLLEQGYGDVLQFLRFVPRLRTLEPTSVTLQTVPPLTRLLQPFAARHDIRLVEASITATDFDCFVSVCSLATLFQITTTDLPGDVPYLDNDPGETARFRTQLPKGKLCLGLCWEGRPSHPQDATRSIEPSLFAPLMPIPDLHLVGLQRPPWQRPPFDGLLDSNWGEAINDFTTTAAMISALDGVITVDTSLAHLAGALGRPAWVLLPYCPDWRWLLDCPETCWYPSLHLVRQTTPGAWPDVMERLSILVRNRITSSKNVNEIL